MTVEPIEPVPVPVEEGLDDPYEGDFDGVQDPGADREE